MAIDKLLEEAAELFRQRNAVYGNNWEKFGKVLLALFPDGMKLKTEDDFARSSTLFHIINKLSRYCQNFTTGGHEDSALDSIVYWAILQELDHVANGEYSDKVAEEAQRECSCEEEHPAPGKEYTEEARAEREYWQGERQGLKERRLKETHTYENNRRQYAYNSTCNRRIKEGSKSDREERVGKERRKIYGHKVNGKRQGLDRRRAAPGTKADRQS